MNIELSNKKILVTGGAGFIGINLVKHLVENTDHTMLVVDRSEENQKRLTSVIGKNTRVIQVTEGYEDVNIETQKLSDLELFLINSHIRKNLHFS